MILKLKLPVENPTADISAITVAVDSNVLNALNAARDEKGEFDEEKYFKILTGFTKTQLDVAFEAVQNRVHWKDSLDVMVDDSVVAVTVKAIYRFHGTEPKIIPLGEGKTRIQSRGYFG